VRDGFYDHSHFTRTFKRIIGTSPGLYRKHHVEAAP
jgi:AraC-like DNA-binding protein